jgi:hypothetical protein
MYIPRSVNRIIAGVRAPHVWLLAAALLSISTTPLAAQLGGGVPRHLHGQLDAGSEEEAYVRNLQLAGIVGQHPWSVRPLPFRGSQLTADSLHPWSRRLDLTRAPRGTYASVLPVATVLRYNSAYPFGSNDGAVWSGRGATLSATAGVAAGAGPISLALRPIAYWAQNAAFPLAPTGFSGRLSYANPQFPDQIDRPQRFGEGSFGRLDPGQSWIRADLGPITAGASTANQWWGPTSEYPLILGNNAPGFAHVFAGTSRPINVLIGTIHGRMIWGRLEQSEFSPVTGSRYFVDAEEPGRVRFATGVVGAFSPRFAPGLELGAGRFFHSLWPSDGIPRRYYTKPLEALFKFSLPLRPVPGYADSLGGEDNQLLSLFARWVLPAARSEFYFDYGREDHAAHMNDLLEEPDHSRMYALGFRTLIGLRADRFSVLRAELFNAQIPITAYHRGEGGIYTHTLMRQGHTHRGQVLGSSVGAGEGAGFVLAWDRYTPGGRRTVVFRRELESERGTYHETGVRQPDTQHARLSLGFETRRFLPAVDVRFGANLVQELNRNFAGDRFNIAVHGGVAFPGW